MAKIRNRKTGEIKEISDKELSKYGLGGNVDMAKNGKKIKMKLKKADVGKFIPTSNGTTYNEFGVENDPEIIGDTGEYKITPEQLGLTDITNQYPFNPGLTDSLMRYNKKKGYDYKPTLNSEEQKQLIDFQDKNKPSLSVNNFSLTPITGNKYLNRGLKYLNQGIQHGMQIGGNPKDYKKPFNYYNGMSNGMFAEGGVNLNNANDSHYNFDTQNQFQNGYPTQINQQQTAIEMNPMGQNSIQSVPSQQINTNGAVQEPTNNTQGASGQNKFYNAMQGVAALTNLTQAGINFGKGALDMAGSKIENREVQNMQNKLYAQSVHSQNIDDRPNDTIYGRNTLAENGMQIREIGGKGMPNINYESKEHIKLPNGFSQEVGGEITHKDGGINGNFPIGTKIYSEKLTIPNKELLNLKNSLSEAPQAESGTEITNLQKTPSNFSFLDYIKIPEKGKMSIADIAKPFETKKNVDMLKSKKGDSIQKETAKLMIDKKGEHLDNVFNFAERLKLGNYFDKEVQKGAMEDYGYTPQEENQEQYMNNMMEYGGIKKAEDGWKAQTFKTKEGITTPTGQNLNQNPLLNWQGYKDEWEKLAGVKFKNTKDLQEFAYDWALDNNPQLLKDIWKTFGVTNKDESKYKNKDVNNLSTQDLKDLRGNFIDNLRGKRMFSPQNLTQIKQPVVNTQPVAQTKEVAPEIQYKDRTQYLKPNVDINGLNLGIPLPNIYGREPLNYYKTNPNYIDPRYLDIQPQLNEITRGENAFKSSLGSRGTSDISNLLQSQANSYAAKNQVFGQKYNYDRQQDSQAQQFNAQAKTQNDLYNQQSWYAQLEDPIRRREGNISTQRLLDDRTSEENIMLQNQYLNSRNYIENTFNPTKNFDVNMLGNNYGYNFNTNDDALTTITYDKKGNIVSRKEAEKKKYGGNIKKPLKIRPKIKK